MKQFISSNLPVAWLHKRGRRMGNLWLGCSDFLPRWGKLRGGEGVAGITNDNKNAKRKKKETFPALICEPFFGVTFWHKKSV